jgi:SSS family solute:Na+ symporter
MMPGLAAYRMFPDLGGSQRFDQALPALMDRVYGPIMLGTGLTALAASLMSGLAANVSGFAAIWTEDIYRTSIRSEKTDLHYLRMARLSSTVAIVVSVAASYLNFLFRDLMEHVQLIFSIFGAPFWAIFLLGMSTRRATAKSATAGFLTGTMTGLLHLVAFTRGWLHYGSVMNANFHSAIYSFSMAIAVTWLASGHRQEETLSSSTLEFRWRAELTGTGTRTVWILALILSLTCVLLNWIWR